MAFTLGSKNTSGSSRSNSSHSASSQSSSSPSTLKLALLALALAFALAFTEIPCRDVHLARCLQFARHKFRLSLFVKDLEPGGSTTFCFSIV